MPDPLVYRLPNPAITSISIDGIEHKVNEHGLLEVHQLTPGVNAEIERHHGAQRMSPRDVDDHIQARRAQREPQGPAESTEDRQQREDLLAKLDDATGRRYDRRKSLAQLRDAWSDVQANPDRYRRNDGGGDTPPA